MRRAPSRPLSVAATSSGSMGTCIPPGLGVGLLPLGLVELLPLGVLSRRLRVLPSPEPCILPRTLATSRPSAPGQSLTVQSSLAGLWL